MKPVITAPMWTIARPLAGAALLVSVSACSLIPNFQSTLTREPEKSARADVQGIPPELRARANELLQVAEEPPRSVLEVRNRLNGSAQLIQDYLSSEGYLAAEVMPSRVDTLTDRPVLQARPGRVFTVSTRGYEGRDAIQPEVAETLDLILEDLPRGAIARTDTIERIDDLLVAQLRRQGYAFARSDGIDVLASRHEANVDLTFMLVPGPQVRLGALEAPEAEGRNAETIRTLKTWRDGDLYTPGVIDRLRTRLRSTGLYDGIGVAVSDAPGADGLHTVTATLVEGKPRTIGAGFSASTTEGVGVDAYWERRNLTGRADRFRVSTKVATLARDLTTTYELPNIGRFGRTLALEAGVRAEETDAYDLEGAKLGASLSQPFSRQLRLSVGAELDATRTIDQRAKIVGGIERELVTLAFPVGLTYTDVGDPLDPQSGLRLFAGVESGVSFGDATPGYTRIHLTGSTYRAISENIVAAFRAEYGAFAGSNAVPPDKLFFAGGGGTVRGYDYQSLSPTDSLGNLQGGRNLFASTAELRWRASERFGYAAFVDFGGAADNAGSLFSDAGAAVGLGVRYYPGFGPIRFDIATPIDPRDGDSPVQVYISIGQAF
ncbi:MAG TPA: BamA/TamA family outer membrane protein [Hyphomonas sp.]|nr:hypothetical protein [Hyphomonas sp.]HRI99433.1 BamA/TamA family outer membrane protein [Hyphomonas sp.]